MLLRFFVIVSLVLVVPACTPRPTPALIPTTLQLDWTYEAQLARFYAADLGAAFYLTHHGV